MRLCMSKDFVLKLLFTVSEACNALGLGRSKFYDEVRCGRLNALKNGKRTYVHIAELSRYVAALGANVQ